MHDCITRCFTSAVFGSVKIIKYSWVKIQRKSKVFVVSQVFLWQTRARRSFLAEILNVGR
jgi:hypothetical protein